MRNFKYAVGDKEYVLSPEEHGQILLLVEKGKSGLMILRGGKLILNLAFIRSANETDDLTAVQEKLREETLKLPMESEKTYQEKRASGQGFMKATHEEFYARMNWEHGENCSCKEAAKEVRKL